MVASKPLNEDRTASPRSRKLVCVGALVALGVCWSIAVIAVFTSHETRLQESTTTANTEESASLPLRLAQWNLAGLNPGCGDEICPGCNVCAAASISLTDTMEHKLLAVKDYFGGHFPDLITLNEDVEFNSSHTVHSFNLGSDYVRASSCRAEALWATEPAFENGGRFMQNSIWVRRGTWQIAKFGDGVISSSKNQVPRCAAVVTLTSGSKKVTVASVHLTGGRYTDANWAIFAGNKSSEIRHLLNLSQRVMGQVPDLVIGDLNSYWNASDVSKHQQSYEPFADAKAKGQEEGYLSWSMEGVKSLNESNYERRAIDQSTTKYGGVVDHIFVKMGSSVKAGMQNAMGVVDDQFKISDHQIIYSELEVF